MLEIRHLKMVQAISEQGSVTRAAEQLHLTQSALSHQLREAEELLGVPLFHRLNKKMILTEPGTKLLRSAGLVLQEMNRASEEIRRIAGGQQGVLRIATQCNTCYHWLPSMLRLFQQQFPKVEVQIVVEATRDPIEAVLDGRLDLAIAYTQISDPRLDSHSLFEDELIAVMPPDHPLATRSFLQPEDFQNQTLIVYSIPRHENLVFQQFFGPSAIQPKSVLAVMLTEAIIEMAKAGIGIAVLARWAIAPYLKSGVLRAVRMTRAGLKRDWSAVMLANQYRPAYYVEFAKLLSKNSPQRRKD